jgi:hypothetical protein
MDKRLPNTSSSTTSVVAKSDTDSLNSPKPIQLNKSDSKQPNVKFVKNDDVNNRLSIYHQNIRVLKGKISEFLLSLPTEAPHLICLTEHH